MASPAMGTDEPPSRDDASPGTASSMVGGDSSPSPSMPDPKEQARGIISQIKQLSTGIEDMAKQFPAGSKEFKMANDNLKDAMAKIITELQKTGGRQGSPGIA